MDAHPLLLSLSRFLTEASEKLGVPPRILWASLLCLVLGTLTLVYWRGVRGRASSEAELDLDDFINSDDAEGKEDTPADIDAYEFLKDVKSGGFSRVKLVQRVGTRDRYAVKLLNIHRAFDEGQVNHTLNEKQILSSIQHPFIVKLYTTFRDNTYLYFLLEYVRGGELFDVLKKQKKLKVDEARFYAANVLIMIEHLHKRKIAFRDIKSENLLFDNEGYLKLIDFGMARYVDDKNKCSTFAGTLDYISPEILSRTPYTEHVDWWALGCLIYEMLTGATPFKGSEEDRFKAMNAYSIDFPEDFDPVAKDLVLQMLNPKYSKRLGTSKDAASKIRNHPWFKDFDWVALVKRELPPPVPKCKEKIPPLTPLKTLLKVKSMKEALENEPPESPRTYSPRAIDTFFSGF